MEYHEYAVAAVIGALVTVAIALLSGFAKLPFDMKGMKEELADLKQDVRAVRERAEGLAQRSDLGDLRASLKELQYTMLQHYQGVEKELIELRALIADREKK